MKKIETIHSIVLKDLQLLKLANSRQYLALTQGLKKDVKKWVSDKMSDDTLRQNLIATSQACHAHLYNLWGKSPEKPPAVAAYFDTYPHRNL